MKYKKPPNKVRIGHLNYKLLKEDNLQNKQGTPLYGRCSQSDTTISISTSIQSKELEAEVILHECLHAMMFNHAQHGLSDQQEESVVNHLGMQLLSFIKDNPKLMEFIINA